MSALHTPGPWSWREQVGTDMPILFGSNGMPVCDFGNCRDYYPSEGAPPDEYDARLIAAAPDLLAALRGLVAWADDLRRQDPAADLAAARAAIAKATGVEP